MTRKSAKQKLKVTQKATMVMMIVTTETTTMPRAIPTLVIMRTKRSSSRLPTLFPNGTRTHAVISDNDDANDHELFTVITII